MNQTYKDMFRPAHISAFDQNRNSLPDNLKISAMDESVTNLNDSNSA
jgi:hypothetical protein